MTDERLDKLGNYFVHHEILNRTGISFGRFLDMVIRGIWDGSVLND